MPRQNLIKLLYRPVVVEVVKMIERGQIQRIMRTICQRLRARDLSAQVPPSLAQPAGGTPEKRQRVLEAEKPISSRSEVR